MAATRFGIDGGISQPWPELSGPSAGPVTRMGVSGGITRYARDFSGKLPQTDIGIAVETDTAFPVVDASVVSQFIQPGIETDSARSVTFTQAPLITTVSSARGTDIVTAGTTLTVNVDNSAGITSVTVNGVALSGVGIINSTEVTGTCPLSLNIAYGSSVNVIVSNGTPSPAYSATVEVPLGMVETDFTVDYASLDPDSPFAGDPTFADIVAGDSCIHSLFTSPSANGVSMDGLGEFTLSGTITVQQQFDYYIFDASDLTASATIEQIFIQPGPVEASIGLASETDSAFSVTGQVATAGTIQFATEIDTALPVSDGSSVYGAISQANETDTAFPVAEGGPIQNILIGLATEADSARPVFDASAPTGTIGIAIETDFALSVYDAAAVIESIGLALETDTALGVSFPATLDSIQDQLTALQVSVDSLSAIAAAQQALIEDLYIRFDLNASVVNTYADDGSSISNAEFTLTKTDNGNGTFDIVRS